MIYFNDGNLCSIVEVIYLEEEFDLSVSSNIHINPENPTYLIGKTIIINTPLYSPDKIRVLRENRCKIISRVIIPEVEDDSIEILPYILRPCFDVSWNGKEINIGNWNSFLEREEDEWSFSTSEYKLYFPKILKGGDIQEPYTDEGGNLSWLGWLLQQVGQNIRTDTVFLDLDLLKTKKMDLRGR